MMFCHWTILDSVIISILSIQITLKSLLITLTSTLKSRTEADYKQNSTTSLFQ
jgi:hypothetical protein